ncbi:MAG TPA: hypothetical protein VF813_08575 [Anaerolineaceae bacterium]
MLALVGLVGVGVILYTTARGAGVGGDATIYLYSARNLLAGKGLGLIDPDGSFRALPYSPPLFPLLLAGFGLLGADMLQAARVMNAVLFGATIFLVGAAFYYFTRSRVMALFSAFLMLVSPVLSVRMFSWAMTEPVFLFSGFLGLFLAIAYAGNPRRGLLFGAAAACAASFLARYIGAGFLGAAAVVLLLLDRRGWLLRARALALFLAVSLLPMAAWVAWDFWQTRTVASRSIQAGVGLGARFLSALPPLKEAVLFWLVPDSWVDAPPYPHALNTLVLAAAALVLLALAWAAFRGMRGRQEEGRPGETRLALGLGILAVVYLAVTLAVYVSTYPPITLDNRMIGPVHVAALLLITVLAGVLLRREGARRWLMAGVWMILLAFGALYLFRSARIVVETHRTGLGYLAEEYAGSETLKAVRALPAGTKIITNEVTLVLYYTGRPSYALISGDLADPRAASFTYGAEAGDAGQAAFRDGAALVLFNSVSDTLNGIYGAQGPARLALLTRGLYQAYTGKDGAIYYFMAP